MCQDNAKKILAASTKQWVDVGAKACPPLCIAAGYSPDKGKIEFASLANIKTVLNNSIAELTWKLLMYTIAYTRLLDLLRLRKDVLCPLI